MVSPYVIDKDIFQIGSETELDSFLAKSNHFFETIKKQSFTIDCDDSGMYNLLTREYLELRQIIDDAILKANLESFWMRYFFGRFIFLPESCGCADCKQCDVIKNVNSIITKTKLIPKFIVTYKKNVSINSVNSIDLNNFYSDKLYCSCRDYTSSEFQTAIDIKDGERIIKMNWTELIAMCSSEITILDRNIFGYWNDNFENGLVQFVDVIHSINPNIKLRLITKKVSVHLAKKNTSDFDIYRKMLKKILELNKIKIEIVLCVNMEHERYIMFDEHIGAELNRGLDTFVPRSNEDKIKITYHNISELILKRNKALKSLINSGDFKLIKNC